MKILSVLVLCLLTIQLYACKTNKRIEPERNSNNISSKENTKMKITIGTHIFTATLYNNATAMAFQKLLPLTLDMSELNGNEKLFDLPDNLPSDASNPGSIKTGDLMLYGSNTLVLFYKSFTTSYNYTQIGQIDDVSGLAAALSSANVIVKFEIIKTKIK